MTIVRRKVITEISISTDWFVEMEESEKTGVIEFWLYHKDYTIKDMMFGIPIYNKETWNIEELIAEMDFIAKPYQELYQEKFMESKEF